MSSDTLSGHRRSGSEATSLKTFDGTGAIETDRSLGVYRDAGSVGIVLMRILIQHRRKLPVPTKHLKTALSVGPRTVAVHSIHRGSVPPSESSDNSSITITFDVKVLLCKGNAVDDSSSARFELQQSLESNWCIKITTVTKVALRSSHQLF